MNHCFVVTPLLDEDYSAWQPLFYEYITWNKASIPVQQYRRTFDRIIDPSSELDALVARDGSDRQKIIGIAQFYPHQNTWMEEKVMHLSGEFPARGSLCSAWSLSYNYLKIDADGSWKICLWYLKCAAKALENNSSTRWRTKQSSAAV